MAGTSQPSGKGAGNFPGTCPMSDSRYFASGVEFASERERLALLESFRDPHTFELLGRFDVREGWRCLEVGAGAGSVVRWLAKRAGSTGRVVAVDIDTRFVEALELANVEIRRHDILADALEAAQYDLVHCRSLLLHLPEPRRALDNMRVALRPGGWLVVEDLDYTPFGSAMREHSLADTFDRTVRASFELLRHAGVMDLHFGRRLPGLLGDLDLTDVGHDCSRTPTSSGSCRPARPRCGCCSGSSWRSTPAPHRPSATPAP